MRPSGYTMAEFRVERPRYLQTNARIVAHYSNGLTMEVCVIKNVDVPERREMARVMLAALQTR